MTPLADVAAARRATPGKRDNMKLRAAIAEFRGGMHNGFRAVGKKEGTTASRALRSTSQAASSSDYTLFGATVLKTSFGVEYGDLSIRRADMRSAIAILKGAGVDFRRKQPQKS